MNTVKANLKIGNSTFPNGVPYSFNGDQLLVKLDDSDIIVPLISSENFLNDVDTMAKTGDTVFIGRYRDKVAIFTK